MACNYTMGSLTPPAADNLQEAPQPNIQEPAIHVDDRSDVYMFTCHRGAQLPAHSYWRNGFVNRTVQPEDDPWTFGGPAAVELFPCLRSNDVITSVQSLNRAIEIFRQHVCQVQTQAMDPSVRYDGGTEISTIRKQICIFLDYMHYTLSRSKMSEDLLPTLTQGLHNVLLDIGRLCDLPAHFTTPSTEDYYSHVYFHTHLDIYWRILAIFYRLDINHPGYLGDTLFMTPDLGHAVSLYDQMLQLVLWDMVHLVYTRHRSTVDSKTGCLEVSMFSCVCLRELWLLMLKLTNQRTNGESFWVCLHSIFKTLLDTEKEEQPLELEDCRQMRNHAEDLSLSGKDCVCLCLWIMYNLEPLYREKLPEHMQELSEREATSNYHDLHTLLDKLLAVPGLKESELREQLKLVVLLTSHWEANIHILVTLWNHFYKRLSELFQCVSSRLDGLACMDTTVSGLYDHCRRYMQGHKGNLDNETSYQLFLRLLCEHIGKLFQAKCTQEWKQLKGRIYSKFHRKRIQELSEVGLYNLTSLFITMGMTADLEDVAAKLVDFYDMLDIRHLSISQRLVIWRGVLALILVYLDRHLDISFLARRINVSFQAAVSELPEAGLDTRHQLWKLINTYMDGLQNIMDTSDKLHLSQHILICASVKRLLSVCSEHQLRTCLATLHAVVEKFRHVKGQVHEDSSVTVSLQYADFNSTLWKNVYSFITEHAQTLTPPSVIADIAASFCQLAFDCPSDGGISAASVFQYFSLSDKVDVSVSCQFLGLLLSKQELMAHLRNQTDNFDTMLLRAWFRYCLHISAESQQLAEITRHILDLSEVKSVFELADLEYIQVQEAPILFLKAIERAYNKIQVWQERIAFQKQVSSYFVDVPAQVLPLMKAMSPPDTINNMYLVTGNLVKYCAKTLYVRQDQVIPRLVSSLLMPAGILKPEKALSPVFLKAIRDNLHLFVEGLAKLSYERDPFIQRKLKDTVVIYLPKFTLKPSDSLTTAIHPVVASLSGSFKDPASAEMVKLRQHVLQLVINNYIRVDNRTIHQAHSLGFSFVYEVCERTKSSSVKAGDLALLLLPCMEYLMLLAVTDSSFKTVVSVLQELALAYSTQPDNADLRSELTETCRKFVCSYFKFSSMGVMKVVEKLSALLPDVVAGAVDKLTDSLRDRETKGGVGVDQKLRNKYYQVLRMLGDRGQREISSLQRQTGIS